MNRAKESVNPEDAASLVRKDQIRKFTPEQEAVLAANIRPGELVLVKAIAGAGKTATLLEFMRRRPLIRFLYLAYNRSAIDEIRIRIANSGIAVADADNIMCRTIDSLAAGSSRVRFSGPKKWYSFWFFTYPAYLRKQRRAFPALSAGLLAMFEDEKKAYSCGVEVHAAMQDFTLGAAEQPECDSIDAQMHARFIWQAVCSGALESPDFAWTVKAVAQLGERLDELGCGCVDVLIVDEAQDINEPMWQIIRNQVYAKYRPVGAIMVGDPNQHLYAFRRCISVFDDVEFPPGRAPTVFALTLSCRFGPAIADYANMLLRSMGSDMTVGTLHPDRKDCVQKVGYNFPRDLVGTCAKLPPGERAVVLFQSNKAMFYCYMNCQQDIEILGSAFGASTLGSLWGQYLGNPSDFSSNFKNKSIMALNPNSELSRDPDAIENLRDELFFSEFIIRNSGQVPRVLQRLQGSMQQNTPAQLVFSTVHQAKGREFHTVVLHPGLRECKGKLERRLRQACSGEDEEKLKDTIKNFGYLYYTASTRPCWNLILP